MVLHHASREEAKLASYAIATTFLGAAGEQISQQQHAGQSVHPYCELRVSAGFSVKAAGGSQISHRLPHRQSKESVRLRRGTLHIKNSATGCSGLVT